MKGQLRGLLCLLEELLEHHLDLLVRHPALVKENASNNSMGVVGKIVIHLFGQRVFELIRCYETHFNGNLSEPRTTLFRKLLERIVHCELPLSSVVVKRPPVIVP